MSDMNQISRTLLSENSYIFFECGQKVYGFPSHKTIEIIELLPLQNPQSQKGMVLGVLNYNNMIINIVDLRSPLNLPKEPLTVNSKILIVTPGETIFGIIADKVLDIINVTPSSFQNPPYPDSSEIIRALYDLNGSITSILSITNIEKLISENKIFDGENAKFPEDSQSKNILAHREAKLVKRNSHDLSKRLYESEYYASFEMEESYYCINLKHLKEFATSSAVNITEIPLTPKFISGVMSLKGEFITVVDLKNFLGKGETLNSERTSILVINSNDIKIGFMVEGSIQMISLYNEEIEEKVNKRYDSKYTKAELVKDKKVYVILDTEQLLQSDKLFIRDDQGV